LRCLRLHSSLGLKLHTQSNHGSHAREAHQWGWPDYEGALKANSKAFEAHIYDGANQGSHNESTPRYDEKIADLA
jgi:carboxymethylenebutenolidase